MSNPSNYNVANALTVVRLLLVPIFGWLLLSADGDTGPLRWWALAVFCVAALTDRYDGHLARRHGLVTVVGAIADPIADKALTGVALIGLSVLGEVPWWMTVVILVREWGITLLRFWVIRHGVISASPGGKLKTVLQMAAIIAFLVPLPAGLDPVLLAVMGAAVLVTVLTGLDYVARAVALRRAGALAEPADRR
ncbi:MAG: CDP-diacylglycerol--glycerol-3-phosphate 3-phosphatidyltransferase [Actinomycetota bacterium]|nr:CDP-diacylglycerol--glycerol-3-phosphate 3-phosphatidyltransferase [Nocardioidaceae bacterium]MDQ3591817.1 CDP-diacylglycerol--glycerol-3-phosphate 3-phosphatidyltransferase [Actinomycetota bacterium]